ncbi:hypothetical protein [Okeania sp. KiyG1]|uniref:hypothetical protein n=1 Tax=Okeania sp. KiyG1 TaxID=2720165 RepID=UPI001923DD97|nr:hypothetical protein [Okeania sp. KiyG1]
MNNCPCCSTQMLRHSRNSQIYWYCLECKQEMPNLVDKLKKQIILNSFREHSCQAAIKNTYRTVETHLHEEKTVMNLLGIA